MSLLHWVLWLPITTAFSLQNLQKFLYSSESRTWLASGEYNQEGVWGKICYRGFEIHRGTCPDTKITIDSLKASLSDTVRQFKLKMLIVCWDSRYIINALMKSFFAILLYFSSATLQCAEPSWGMGVGNVSRLACVFSVFSTIQGNTIAKLFMISPRLHNCYNHFPCARAADVDESLPLARLQLIKTVEAWSSC